MRGRLCNGATPQASHPVARSSRPRLVEDAHPSRQSKAEGSMDDQVVRESLIELLTKGNAHVTVGKALDGLKPELRAKRPAEGVHSVWEELEHMRIAQEDILRYTIDQGWTSPDWPQGYWPSEAAPDDAAWKASV